MNPKKINYKYCVSVEGETEKWYFEWLQQQINNCITATSTVSFGPPKIQKDPVKYVKGLTGIGTLSAVHVFDKESNDAIHTTQFIETLKRLRDSKRLGKKIKYSLGYSNYTFDLWMILHKSDCNSYFADRSQYITPINTAYGEHFMSMDAYKHETNFKRLLSRLNLHNVVEAVSRAESIRANNVAYNNIKSMYGHNYFDENPDLSIQEFVGNVLKQCGIM